MKEMKRLYDYVLDAGTYTQLDYDFAAGWFAAKNDNWGGGCTAVATVVPSGDTLVGRNMDLNISNKAAYVFHTDVEGCYKTVGLAYTFRDYSPDYKDALEKGISDEFYRILPFISDDVLNSEGLYVELNMRYGEFWPTGEPKFCCSGTNPESDQRVYIFELPRYIGEHCKTVSEAVEYVKTLDVYTQNGYWNYCFILADATGHYGLLEYACNNVIWHDMHPAQANFYIDEYAAAIQELKSGLGRYSTVMDGIKDVKDEKDMLALMNKVTYFQMYDPKTCQFDPRSEIIGSVPFATEKFVLADELKDDIMYVLEKTGEYVRGLSRQQLQDANEYWESSFTEVINCNKKTLFVRFFENDSKTLTLSPC